MTIGEDGGAPSEEPNQNEDAGTAFSSSGDGENGATLGKLDPSFYLVGVGASAGGLDAIKSLLSEIPDDWPHSLVIVQHLAPDYKSLMRELLQRETPLKVKEVEQGMEVEPRHIYLIPPKSNIIIQGTSANAMTAVQDVEERSDAPMKFELLSQPLRHQLNLPIDLFFHSLAEAVGDRAVAIILSGAGSDGSRGLMTVKDVGGFVLAQQPETAEFTGMPTAAIQSGGVDLIAPAAELAGELNRYFKARSGHIDLDDIFSSEVDEDLINSILSTVSKHTQVNYTCYKMPTLRRRIARRMVLGEHDGLQPYLDRLQADPDECLKLGREFLVGVTSFFRDMPAWDALREKAFGRLFASGPEDQPLKVWSVGCSTGEEAYTIACMLDMYRETRGIKRDFRVFATDLNAASIEFARHAIYPSSVLADVPAEFRGRMFRFMSEGVSVSPEIRKRVIVAPHDATQHPPYIGTDLIICRNTLIYLSTSEQNRLVDNFSYSLNEGGVLFLGLSESADRGTVHFSTLNKRFRIYVNDFPQRRPTASAVRSGKYFVPMAGGEGRGGSTGAVSRASQDLKDLSFVDQILRVSSTCAIVVDANNRVIKTVGEYRRVLNLPDSGFSDNLSELLPHPLNTVVNQGLRSNAATNGDGWHTKIPFEIDNESLSLNIHIRAMGNSMGAHAQSIIAIRFEPLSFSSGDEAGYSEHEKSSEREGKLEAELRITRQALETSISELADSNEELQTTNEELMATNEELQATNEEMQSVNEELYAINAEFTEKINELEAANADIDNLLANASVHAVFVDARMCVRRFSEHSNTLFALTPNDVGRPLRHFSSRLKSSDHSKLLDAIDASIGWTYDAQQVGIDRPAPRPGNQFQCEDIAGNFYIARIDAYGDASGRARGVMVSFVDVTEQKHLRDELEDNNQVLEGVLEAQMAGYWDWNIPDNTEYLSPAFKKMFGYEDHEVENTPEAWQELIHPEDLPGVLETFDAHVKSHGEIPYDNEVRYRHKDGSIVWVWCRGAVVEWTEEGDPVRMVGCHVDITSLKEREEQVKKDAEEIRRFTFIAAHDLREPLTTNDNYINMLNDHLSEQADEFTTRMMDTIRQGNQRMRKLIIGILEFGSLFNDQQEFGAVELKSVFTEAERMLENKFKENGA
tara:strand:+ start:123897 stop:127331 length:3435 start_codon:yes stop_codon:yes gene_type:complete